MSFLIHRMKITIVKVFILCTLVLSVSTNASFEQKEQSKSRWQKIKEVLLSKPAKIAYGFVTIAVGAYGIGKMKKWALEREQARSLRNGQIVFSWLGEQRHKELSERFIDRYMPKSRDPWYHTRPYFYSIDTRNNNSEKIVIIRDNGIGRGNSASFFRNICRDINDMNAYTASTSNPTGWSAAIEQQEPLDMNIFPLSEDFDVPKYQVIITIPK